MLYKILVHFNAEKWRHLQQFMRSEYFNSREDLCKIVEYMKGEMLEKQRMPDKKMTFAAVFPDKTYDDQHFRLLISYLHKLVQQFLVVDDWLQDEREQNIAAIRAFRKNALDHHLQRAMKACTRHLERSGFRNAEYYAALNQLERERYYFTARDKRVTEMNLQELTDYCDYAFIIDRLRQSCWIIAHQTVYKKEYQPGLLPQILQYVKQKELTYIPAIGVYYNAYMALSNGDEQYFKRFKIQLLQYREQFSTEELRDLFILAINYCTKQYNLGKTHLLEEELELYREGLADNVFLTNGRLSRFTYRNITTLCLIFEELDYLEEFLDTYRSAIVPEYREQMYAFERARLLYARNQYGEALQLLQQAEYSDLYLNLGAKMQMVKIYYETGEYDVLAAHIRAMRSFIRRKGKIGYLRDNYRRALRFVQALIDLAPYNTKGKKALLIELKNTVGVAEKNWLLEKVTMSPKNN